MQRSIRLASLTVVLMAGLAWAGAGLTAHAAQQKGRYKKDGSSCKWDANDSGPNQCTPVTPGRFTKKGDTCSWDASGVGADECRPAKGRFKKEGNACVWNATDNGPDQCDPRQAK